MCRGLHRLHTATGGGGGGGRDAVEGEGPQRRPQRRLDRRLEEVTKAVGGGYCQLQMPLKLALGVRETVAGHRLGALGGGGGGAPLPMHPWGWLHMGTAAKETGRKYWRWGGGGG